MKRTIFILFIFLALLSLGALPGRAAPSFALTATLSPAADLEILELGSSPFFANGKETDFPYTAMGPVSFLPGFNPLTGLPVSDPTLLLRRPIAIKITNYPRYVRPQPGLSFADVVYEYYLEEGISRFIAVYYGQDASRVGPVRSGRLFDEHVFNMYEAIFVFGYADPDVMAHYRNLGEEALLSFALEGQVDDFHNCSAVATYPLCRDNSLQTYNNLFANTSALGPAVVDNGSHNNAPDLNGMRFSYQIPPEGLPAEKLFFRYSLIIYGKWEYDSDSGSYLRFQEEMGYRNTSVEEYDRLNDALTDEQISADNVVALFVPHSYYKKTDSTEIFEIDLSASGQAIVFRNGLSYPAIWERPSDGGVLNLFTLDGEPFPLKPGQTWYEVLSLESTQSQNGSEWRFVFGVPEVPKEKVYPPTLTPTP